jgi:hypothetical protein
VLSHLSDNCGSRAPGEVRRHPRNGKLLLDHWFHALHDGFTDLLNVPPLLQASSLSYAAIGALKTVYSGATSGQIPSGKSRALRRWRAGDRHGAIAVGYGLAGLTGSLYGDRRLAGLGGSTQHPIGSSPVSAAFPPALAPRWVPNFTGDVGKMARVAVRRDRCLSAGSRRDRRRRARRWALAPPASLKPVPLHSKGDEAKAGWPHGRGPIGCCSPSTSPTTVMHCFMIFLPFLLRDKGADLLTIGLACRCCPPAARRQAGDAGSATAGCRASVISPKRDDLLILVLLFSLSLPPRWSCCRPSGDERHLVGAYGTVPESRPERRTHAFRSYLAFRPRAPRPVLAGLRDAVDCRRARGGVHCAPTVPMVQRCGRPFGT